MIKNRQDTPVIELLQIRVTRRPNLFIAHHATKFPGICMAPDTAKLIKMSPPTWPMYCDMPNRPIPQTIQLKKIDKDFTRMLGVRNRSRNEALWSCTDFLKFWNTGGRISANHVDEKTVNVAKIGQVARRRRQNADKGCGTSFGDLYAFLRLFEHSRSQRRLHLLVLVQK